MQIITKAIAEIIPYDKNPRNNNKAVEPVAESIKAFGFKVPIVIDKDNVIVAGHTRYRAAQKLGLKEVPCIMADDLNEEQVKAYRLADNKVAELATWDDELLAEELEAITELDMEAFGFDLGADDGIEAQEDDFTEDDIPEEPRTKTGDIWKLGNHRLMCGDSTSITDVKKLVDGAQIDLVFTDPPYGMKKEKDGVANDNLNYDDLLEFNRQWIPITFDILKNTGSWYCWGIDEPLMDIYSNILRPMQKDSKITFRNLITWDKKVTQGQMTDAYRMYPIADEKCLFVMCGVQESKVNSDNYYEAWESIRNYLCTEWRKISSKNNWADVLGNQMGKHYFTKSQWNLPNRENYEKLQNAGKKYGAFQREYDELLQEYESTRAYFNNTHDNMNNVWHFDRTTGDERKEAGGHATPKPIALCGRAIKSSSREGENVLDVFGGSGSTLIACEQLERNAYLMELEPKWCDVIIARWEKLTGKKAVLVE